MSWCFVLTRGKIGKNARVNPKVEALCRGCVTENNAKKVKEKELRKTIEKEVRKAKKRKKSK